MQYVCWFFADVIFAHQSFPAQWPVFTRTTSPNLNHLPIVPLKAPPIPTPPLSQHYPFQVLLIGAANAIHDTLRLPRCCFPSASFGCTHARPESSTQDRCEPNVRTHVYPKMHPTAKAVPSRTTMFTPSLRLFQSCLRFCYWFWCAVCALVCFTAVDLGGWSAFHC